MHDRDANATLRAEGLWEDPGAAGRTPANGDAVAPARMLLQWHVTERCNLRCTHCYQEDVGPPHPSWEELLATLERLEAFLAACRANRAGLPFRAHITVTGGEPFVRSDFMRLLERLAAGRARYSFAVLTNGTAIDRERARALARLRPGFVQVSLDGRPETHDRIRGRGSHARAVEGIRNLVGAGVPTFLSFTAQPSNFRDFPAVARLGRGLGVARVWSDRLIPQGQGGQLHDAVMSPQETREWVELMRAERSRGWLACSPVALHRALQFADSGSCSYRCAAGDTLLAVLPNGEVVPCRRMPIVVGNLHDEPLETLYAENPTLRWLRDRSRVSAGCERCFYSDSCGGGLRCLSYAVHGDAFRADPGCWLAADRASRQPEPPRSENAQALIRIESLLRRNHDRNREATR